MCKDMLLLLLLQINPLLPKFGPVLYSICCNCGWPACGKKLANFIVSL